jgi:hypothetical protein
MLSEKRTETTGFGQPNKAKKAARAGCASQTTVKILPIPAN